MAEGGYRTIQRKVRVAARLPGRVAALEDRQRELEDEVRDALVEMRHELAEIRALLGERLAADAEATELIGRLLQQTTARLEVLERASMPTPSEAP